MLKIFSPKVVDRVSIGYISDIKIAKELNQAKGVMNNYLRDKHFTINISDSELRNDEYIDIEGLADSKKSKVCVPVKKEGDTHFLRKVYKTIEIFAKDLLINTK